MLNFGSYQQNSTAIKKPDKEILKKAIIDNYGNISDVAKALDCDRQSVYNWIEADGLEDARKEGRNNRLDFVENAIDKRVKKGDTTAMIFILKTLGKDRGYIERQEVEQKGQANITIVKNFKSDDSSNSDS